ncbi:hypothetical protein ACFP3U_15880 [Kitasatospora misakiensis]|uniref:Uncharacterized protein n=1 Tax=Kitasatospora misakiensis TaxID=67330 RepID=A0ABW0X640_9ACTN
MAGIDRLVGERISKGRRRKGLLQRDLRDAISRSESWAAFISRAEAHAGAGNVEAACTDGHVALELVTEIQHLPRPPIPTSHPDGHPRKRDYVADGLGNAPAVLIDDDFTGLDHLRAAERTDTGYPTPLIQPDPHVGLQGPHITAAMEWASALARR